MSLKNRPNIPNTTLEIWKTSRLPKLQKHLKLMLMTKKYLDCIKVYLTAILPKLRKNRPKAFDQSIV